MKKLLLGALLLLSVLGFSQITKQNVKEPIVKTRLGNIAYFTASAEIYDDHAVISFRDCAFEKIVVIKHFTLTLEDFESLYLILNSEDNKVGDFYTLNTMDGKILSFKFVKSFGYLYPMTVLSDNSNIAEFPNLTKSQRRKLFNKKQN